MDIDLESLTKVLNDTAQQIKEVTNKMPGSPVELMPLVQPIMENFTKLQRFGDLKGIKATGDESTALDHAIQNFLTHTKEAEEKAGAFGAAIFANPQFKELTANLEQVKASLKRGERVEPKEGGAV